MSASLVSLITFVLLVIIVIKLCKATRVVPNNQRILIFRLGKFSTVQGPGLQIIVPFIDTCKLVPLDSAIPGWKGLSQAEILDRVVQQELGQAAFQEWVDRGRTSLGKR